MATGSNLPKRFAPFLKQALEQAALRYGSEESGLASILGQVTRDYGRQQQAQTTAGASLMGTLRGADTQLQNTYSDAGLTPTLLSQIGNSPTGQRLAGELATNRAAVQQQMTGAQAGQQYLQRDLFDKYSDNVGQISDQSQALTKERGLYTSSILDQLIGNDRSARSAANAAARQQQHADSQAELDRQASQGNALIGQGLVVGEDGTLTPLPGGKADPAAPGNKKPRTTGPGTASEDAQRTAGESFSSALNFAKGLTKGKGGRPGLREGTVNILVSGREASEDKSESVYEDVPVLDAAGRPTGKTKRQPKLDPKTGQQIKNTSKGRPGIPKFEAPIAQAATEQALLGYVTTQTVRALQKLGYSVNNIPGLVTQNQRSASRPPQSTAPSTGRPVAGS